VRRKPEERPADAPTITEPGNDDPGLPIPGAPPATTDTLHPPNIVNEAADVVPTAVEDAKTAVAKLNGYDGRAMDRITTVTSSDLCGTILGYVDRVVKLGDIVSQVLLTHALSLMALQLYTIFRSIRTPSWHGKR
jgi:hypothetical protein